MGVNYTTKFSQLGKLVKYINAFSTLESTTLPADLADILTQYGTTNTGVENSQSQVSGLTDSFLALMQAVGSMKSTLANFGSPTLTDYDTVVSQITGASSQDITTVLLLMYRDMIENAQTVTKSTVTLGTVSAAATNVGTGVVLIDKQLDGFNSPVSGGPVNPLYVGVDSEVAFPSTSHAWVCTSDSYSGSTQPGAESLSWNDGVNFGVYSPFPEGAGSGPSLTAAGGISATTNGYFSSFSGGVPGGWKVVSGTANVNILQDTVNTFGTNSTSSLKFQGDGSTTKIAISNAASAGTITPRRRYCVSFYAQRTTGSGASGVLNVSFTGTGYTASSTEQVNVAVSAVPTSWTLYRFWITAPVALPTNFTFQISVIATLNAGTSVNFANAFVTPVTYFGGFNAVAVGGKVPFATQDKFTATVTNDGAGLFQEFARVNYGFQFPSAPNPAPTGSYEILLPFSLFTATGAGSSTLPNSLAS